MLNSLQNTATHELGAGDPVPPMPPDVDPPIKEPEPDRLPDEDPIPNPDENDGPAQYL